ncbi:MAG: hypothetical protein Q8R04_00325 [Nanoarchaeota archaeon]|nr:hypothetical protein [Nanoarchaeota archaeon]
MFSLSDSNFNKIALILTSSPTAVAEESAHIEGRTIVFAYPVYGTHVPLHEFVYMHRQNLLNGRVLDVKFTETFSSREVFGHCRLEIILTVSDITPIGFETSEAYMYEPRKVGESGGIYGWLAAIGNDTRLEAFNQYNGPSSGVKYNLKARTKVKLDQSEKKTEAITPDEITQINQKYQRLASEVLAVLEGKAHIITVS